MEFRIEIVGVAIVLLAAAAGYYYYYYVRKRQDMDMVQANAGVQSRASQASATASVKGSRISQAAVSRAGVLSPPAGSQLAVAGMSTEETGTSVSGQGVTGQEEDLEDITANSNPLLQSSVVGSSTHKSTNDPANLNTLGKTASETDRSQMGKQGSLQMHYEGSQTETESGVALSTLGEPQDIDEEGTLVLDCCSIVSVCLLAVVAILVGICYLHGLTFQQLIHHPRFLPCLSVAFFVSALVIFAYMHRLGHIRIFVDESPKSVGAAYPASGSGPSYHSAPSSRKQRSPKVSRAGSMTLGSKASYPPFESNYPVRATEIVKRVCPPDPCPFGGGAGARDSKVKAMSAAQGESPSSQQVPSKAGDVPSGKRVGGEASAEAQGGGTAGGGVGSGDQGVPFGDEARRGEGIGASGVPLGEGEGVSAAQEGKEGAGISGTPGKTGAEEGARTGVGKGEVGSGAPGVGSSGATQGEPIVISPDETIQESEGIEGGAVVNLPPFDVHAAAVVPCGTWIDDTENREWAVQERMKKVVDIVEGTSDVPLTAEELACLNRIRALEGKEEIVLGPGVVTRLQDTLYPIFKEDTPVPVVEEEIGPSYVSEVQDILAPFMESSLGVQQETSASENWPWWCPLLVPLLLLLAFIIWMLWPVGVMGALAWLWDMLCALASWLVALLATPAGLLAAITAIALLLAILYYLCTSPEYGGSWRSLSGTQPGAGQPMSSRPGAVRPVSAQPGTTHPMSTQPGTAHPITSGTSGTGQPISGTQPGSAQPMSTQPGRPTPMGTQPGRALPMGTRPGTVQPGSAQPVGRSIRPATTLQPGTEEPGYFDNACQYIGETVDHLAEMGYGKRPKEFFKITYEEDISEEMWQRYKQRQQNFYVTGGSAIPGEQVAVDTPSGGGNFSNNRAEVSQQQIVKVGSSPVSEQASQKSVL